VVDGALYVPAHNGKSSRWYQAQVRQKRGGPRCRHDEGSAFDLVNGPINDLIDKAYWAKYHGTRISDDRRTRPLRDSHGHAARAEY
jgi:hypothetical protein